MVRTETRMSKTRGMITVDLGHRNHVQNQPVPRNVANREELERRTTIYAWRAHVEAIRRGDFEMTVEEFGPIITVYRQMIRLGVTVDPMAEALLLLLEREAQGTDEDGDEDAHDHHLSDGDDCEWHADAHPPTVELAA